MSDTTPTGVSFEFSSDSINAARSGATRLALDGQDITRFVSAVTLSSSVRDFTRVSIEIQPRAGFALTLPADVVLHATVLPGFRLVEHVHEHGKHWTAERIEIEEPAP